MALSRDRCPHGYSIEEYCRSCDTDSIDPRIERATSSESKRARATARLELKKLENGAHLRATDEVVYLDSLNGFAFEDFCAHLFRRLNYGYVQVMPYVGDKGRDLMIQDIQGRKIVVECKHHPHGVIGRPVVQKLHSAVVTENAIKGILVTTGKFSAEAVAHAREISPRIELVDMNGLRDLCDRAQVHLVSGGEESSVFYFPFSSANNVARNAVSAMMPRIISSPRSASDLLDLSASELTLRPIYRIRYNVHHDFGTSVGVIHRVHADNQELMLDGTNARLIDPALHEFLRLTPAVNETPEAIHEAMRGSFQVDQTTLMQRAKETIARHHSEKVGYYGRNNVHYSTVCTPGERSIFLRDVKQVFVPEWSVSLNALFMKYRFSVVEKPGALFFLQNEVSVCKICRQRITKEIVICNSCGNMAHKGKSHSYTCKVCAKTICRNCTHWMRKWLLFKTYLCGQCALEKKRLHKKTRPLEPEHRRRYCVNCGARIPRDAIRCVMCKSDQPELNRNLTVNVTYSKAT
jgi:restriction system protein